MSKLFALENIDGGTDDMELEAAPEVGEVADVQAEVQEEAAVTAKSSDAISEGMDAADSLEQVEDLVSEANEGEGLDPVAAEAVRLAVESICARVGADPKAMYSLYAVENFRSPSSRKANTQYALEGIGEFLKDMWKKIKAALTRNWEKVKAFWDKHVSSLGRVKKALDSMKTKVSESSGKLKDKAFIEDAPSGLRDAVGFNGDISVKSISTIIATHKKLLDSSEELVAAADAFNKLASTDITNPAAAAKALGKLPDMKVGPVVGGVTVSYKFERDQEEGAANLIVERENVDRKDKGGVSLAEKNDVKGLVEEMSKVITDNIKYKDKVTKLQDAFNKLSLAIEKAINNSGAKEDKVKDMRNSMKIAYKINAKIPNITTDCLGLNIKLAKSVLGYAALCLSNYK